MEALPDSNSDQLWEDAFSASFSSISCDETRKRTRKKICDCQTKNCSCPTENSEETKLNEHSNMEELKLSLTSLISNNTTVDNNATSDNTLVQNGKLNEKAFEKWLSQKKVMEREKRELRIHLQKMIKEEKQSKVKLERDNFVTWLQIKKQKEQQDEAMKNLKALKEETKKKEEKQKREEKSKLEYQQWLKRKEEELLAKKLNSRKQKIEKEEREKQRLEKNQDAYQKWLATSKDKPKPIPLNQGIESLKSSASVTYVNPNPWVPNVNVAEIPHK